MYLVTGNVSLFARLFLLWGIIIIATYTFLIKSLGMQHVSISNEVLLVAMEDRAKKIVGSSYH